MAVKYIQKNKNGLWAISNSKAGKTLRTTNTQKEAIAIAGSTKSTEGIMIKRASGWTPATGWDQQIANSTKSKTTRKEEKIEKTEWAEKSTAKKPVAKKPAAKKPAAKKPAAKKPAAKKVAAKKPTAKKPVAKKVTPKAVVAPKASAPKVETKKAPVKQTEVKKTENTQVNNKKGLPGWAGLLIGLLIIGTVVGTAFLLGYFL